MIRCFEMKLFEPDLFTTTEFITAFPDCFLSTTESPILAGSYG